MYLHWKKMHRLVRLLIFSDASMNVEHQGGKTAAIFYVTLYYLQALGSSHCEFGTMIFKLEPILAHCW